MGMLGATKAKKEEPAPTLHEQLTSARASHAKAVAAVAQAQQRFDVNEVTAADVLALSNSERLAMLQVEKCERLIEAEKAAESARKRAELERRRDRLAHELSDAMLNEQRRPLAEKEAGLLIEVARVRAQRRALEGAVFDKARELARTREALGESVPVHFMSLYSLVPAQAAVREKLQGFIAAQPHGDHAARFADRLIDQLVGSMT